MGSAPDAGADDIDAAVQAPRAAFRESGWPQLAPKERARYLRALADDVEHGLDIARRVETGSIGVNFAGMAPNAPFGGVKSSGIGRESGPEGFEEYMTTKSIARQA